MRNRPGRVLTIVVALVISLAVATRVLADEPRATDGPDSPVGVVRAYLEALVDEDPEAAAGLLAPDGPCDADDVERAYLPDLDRALLLGSEVEGDTAWVEVELEERDGAFAAFGFTETHVLRLSSTDAGWRITGRPWPLYECGAGF